MLGKSTPEYIFIKVAIAALQLIAPLSVLCVACVLLLPAPVQIDSRWAPIYICALVYACLEAGFFTCIYLPRCHHLQKAAIHPVLSREERQELFRRCIAYFGSAQASGWFYQARNFQRKNVLEWLLWAFFSTSTNASCKKDWEDETTEYLIAVEKVLGRVLPDGYNKDTLCMRPTLDSVSMSHRPLLWYLIVGVVDFVISIRLYMLGFCHYSEKGLFHSFPPRPLTLFSHPSKIKGLSYWYRLHRSDKQNPILFLHGIGIGLYPYMGFLVDLASENPEIGIVVPEFLYISSRITAPPLPRDATVAAVKKILDTLSLQHVVIAAHSYGTVITAQLLRDPDLGTRIIATLLVDPIPFLLHLPDVAYNFMYRPPRHANEWLLWYFSSRDPDVSRTLARHFFWTENILWKEDLKDKVVAVALSGQDQVVNVKEVRRYLTGADEEKEYWRQGQLEVLYFPELDHAMVFDVKKRWRKLIDVLDRFVRRLD